MGSFPNRSFERADACDQPSGTRGMVSVVIIARGNAERLLDLVTSVYPQLDAHDEIVIALDPPPSGMPSDMTREVAFEIARQIPLVRVLEHNGLEQNGFEAAVLSAQGNFVFLAEPGDVWLPNKVANVLDAFAMSGSILILHDAELCNPAGALTVPSLMTLHGSKPGLSENLTHNAYLGSCLAFLEPFREFFLPLPAEAVRFDQWMGLVAEVFGGVALLTKPLIRKVCGDTLATDAFTNRIPSASLSALASADAGAPAPVSAPAPSLSPRELRNEQRKLLKALKKRERELASVLRELGKHRQDGTQQ